MKERMAILFSVVTTIDNNPASTRQEDARSIVNSELNQLARESGFVATRDMSNGEI